MDFLNHLHINKNDTYNITKPPARMGIIPNNWHVVCKTTRWCHAWKRFSHYWPFVRRIYRWPVESSPKGPISWSSYIPSLAWANCSSNGPVVGDLRRLAAHIMSWHFLLIMDFSLQPTVMARDLGLPTPRQSTNRATVIVNVVRNENAPIFFNQTYNAVVRQDVPNGHNVITISASDADTAVSYDYHNIFGTKSLPRISMTWSCNTSDNLQTGQIRKMGLSCYLVLLSFDSKTRWQDKPTFVAWPRCWRLEVDGTCSEYSKL